MYGTTNKRWCDFANQEDDDESNASKAVTLLFKQVLNKVIGTPITQDDEPTYKYAAFWELGLFYLPTLLMFFVNIIVYIRIIVQMRRNSRHLLERRKIVKQQQENEERERLKLMQQRAEKKRARRAKLGGQQQQQQQQLHQNPFSTPPRSRSSSRASSANASPNHPSIIHVDGASNDLQHVNPVISSVSPASFVNPLARSSAQQKPNITTPLLGSSSIANSNNNAIAIPNFEDDKDSLPFNFQLSQVTLSDLEEYDKFVQAQTRTASYYIIAFTVNSLIWIAARLTWEFAHCHDKDKFIFIIVLILLQCTGIVFKMVVFFY